MTTLVLLENRAQVMHVSGHAPPNARFVALTAEALEALEAREMSHQAIGEFADTRQLAPAADRFNRASFELAQEIEAYIAQKYPPARFEGPGFLSGQAYYIQYSVEAILTRAFLAREAIRAFTPGVVMVFSGKVDPLFADDGYAHDPWLIAIKHLAHTHGARLDMQPIHTDSVQAARPLAKWLTSLPYKALRMLFPRLRRYPLDASTVEALDGLKLLMMDSVEYDWRPVLEALRQAGGAHSYACKSTLLDAREWTRHYTPFAQDVFGGQRYDFDAGPAAPEEDEIQSLGALFDNWLKSHSTPPRLEVLDIDVFPALVPHLKAIAALSPALARYTDALTKQMLDIVEPNAVCFRGMPWLAAKRVAYQCRRRGVPVLSYQHGSFYGTHVAPPHEQTDFHHADYFLSYGKGILPREEPVFPVRAEFVPVGSTRIEQIRIARLPTWPNLRRRIRVLWIGGLTTQNTLASSFNVEDTRRYHIQRVCLALLNKTDALHVIYRPYPHQAMYDGTTQWAGRCVPAIEINITHAIDQLIRGSDLVITDTASANPWNETLGLGKPLVLFCDPSQTLMYGDFIIDLDQACLWCQSEMEIVEAVQRLCDAPHAFITEVSQRNTRAFLQKYVLHHGDCVEHVLDFLHGLIR